MENDDLSQFLSKIDRVEALVSDLRTSDDTQHVKKALKRADEYLAGQEGEDGERVVHNRTLINTGGAAYGNSDLDTTSDTAHFTKTLEDDAKERGERRKERESKGREHKKRGNALFRAGQYDTAIDAFSVAIQYTPWDVSLYTNRALAYNQLGCYSDAVRDCDAAIELKPCTLKAYLQKAKALVQLQRVEEAEQCYCEARKQFTDKADYIDGLQRDT